MTTHPDLVAFLRYFRPNRPITFVAIVPDGPTKTRTFNGANSGPIIDWIQEHNAARNIYYTLNGTAAGLTKKPTKEQIARIYGTHADIDPRDGEGQNFGAERERLAALAVELASPIATPYGVPRRF